MAKGIQTKEQRTGAEHSRRERMLELYKKSPIPGDEILGNLGLFMRCSPAGFPATTVPARGPASTTASLCCARTCRRWQSGWRETATRPRRS